MKVTVFTLWTGPLPKWMSPLIENRNKVGHPFHWVIMGDQVPTEDHGRVQMINLPEKEFYQKVSDLGLSLGKHHQKKKFAELRPMYAAMFPEMLQDSDFWGWSDLDVVFGRVARFWDGAILSTFDFLSLNIWMASGPLTLIRNTPIMNNMWTNIPDVKNKLAGEKFCSVQCTGFGKAVWDAYADCRIRAIYGPRPSNDREATELSYKPKLGILYDALKVNHRKDEKEFLGREIIAFHFPKTKTWPFPPQGTPNG